MRLLKHISTHSGVLYIATAAMLALTLQAWRGDAHEVITTKITFNKEVVRILAKSCMSCHRPNGMAPMALTSYQEVRPWAKAIKEEVLERRMPPWHAVAGYGEFANDPSLASREIDLLTAWADGGAPKGEDKDLPVFPDFTEGWSLGPPDLILDPATPYTISPGSSDECRCFVLHNPSGKDRWIRAIDLRLGERSLVRHAVVWLDHTGRSEQLDAEDEKPGYGCSDGPGFSPSGNLGGWVPGQKRFPLPPGVAYYLPKGARLVAQIRYRNSDTEAKDLTRVGLYFSKAATKQIRDIAIMNRRLEIPPREPLFSMKALHTFQQDAEALSILPRMHRLGKSIEVTAVRPDGTREVLVWIRNYDFNWQSPYIFKKPVSLPKGTRVAVTAYYDNSDQNSRDPNYSTNAEMCVAYLSYILKTNGPAKETVLSGQ